jgi:Mg2+-importing ATPase
MPFDNVDPEYLKKPKKWNTKGIKQFMFAFGLISTILDVICFAVLWFIMKFNTTEKAVLFQTGWFAFGIISQTLIIHMIRTHKTPFIKSKSSKQLLISTFAIVIITLLITFTNIATVFDLSKLPYSYMLWIMGLLILYIIVIQIYKKIYLRKGRLWL